MSSNVDRLRDFIKHAYVDRIFSGDRRIDKPPRMKGDKDDFREIRTDTDQSGSRSPPYEDTYERPVSAGRNDERNSRYSYGDRRSPGYGDRRSPGYAPSDYRRSPGYFEVVDDRVKDDRVKNLNQNRKIEDHKFPDEVRRPEGRSPNHQKDLDMSSPPVVRPVRDILGDSVPPLRIGEPPKANVTRVADTSAQTQPWGSSVASNVQNLLAASTGKLPQVAPNTGFPSHPPPVEYKPTVRKAFPEDLFTVAHPPTPQGASVWQAGLHYGMGYGMQYPNPVVTYPQSSKSANPFDLGNEQRLVHALTIEISIIVTVTWVWDQQLS
ncbi:hypothetical protein QJS10_CPA07g00483 [Acorus calamus]|uniref:Uncharacterized protein n=1 Tax=Acorus calamus TaxID=4465 RepID=A0AAV9EEF3_ACOCL|nr:hypothetical protein QJS10_CPA07g00483 [Acorus calamus]